MMRQWVLINIVKFCPNPATLKSTPSNINTTTLCNNPEKSFDLYQHNLPAGYKH